MDIKTALITGASSGIGRAFAEALAEKRANLILVARSEDKLTKLAEDLRDRFAIDARIVVQDLAVPGATRQVSDRVAELGWDVDLLVNNAGFGDYGPFVERELTRQTEMIQLNVSALVELTHLFLPSMLARQSGGIINVASIAAFQPLPYLSVYAASKAFILSFTESLWAENRGRGVRILALCPGPTESQFFEVAGFPRSMASNKKGSLVTSEAVVAAALAALDADRPTLVTGGLSNQAIVNLNRFIPRDWLVGLLEKQFRAR